VYYECIKLNKLHACMREIVDVVDAKKVPDALKELYESQERYS
jgi:hypothetical protein